jgi:2'-5' RNA ligase
MRTFIAIEIPGDIKQRMADVQATLRKAAVDASWPRSEGIHLTLKFLGEVPDAQVPDIAHALRTVVQGMSRFRLEIAGTGAFPNARNARVVWIGVKGDLEKLNGVQAAIEEAMVRIGMEREERAFKPHLTLARIKYTRSRESLLSALEQVKNIRLPEFEVRSVSLMKSELKPSGAEYTELARVELR